VATQDKIMFKFTLFYSCNLKHFLFLASSVLKNNAFILNKSLDSTSKIIIGVVHKVCDAIYGKFLPPPQWWTGPPGKTPVGRTARAGDI